jgi:hypothetical protein
VATPAGLKWLKAFATLQTTEALLAPPISGPRWQRFHAHLGFNQSGGDVDGEESQDNPGMPAVRRII